MGPGAPVSPLEPVDPLLLVAGPCVLEDDDTNLRIARHLLEVGARLRLRVCYKASFDKANRTSLSSPRGPGLETGLRRLRRVREETGLAVLTDLRSERRRAAVRAAARAGRDRGRSGWAVRGGAPVSGERPLGWGDDAAARPPGTARRGGAEGPPRPRRSVRRHDPAAGAEAAP